MAAIVRWTTPIIVYKPSQVEVNDIEEIYVVLRQGGQIKIEKGIEEASKDEEGFTWQFSQAETGLLDDSALIKVQIDYKTASGQRFTTLPTTFEPLGSGINEEI